MTKHKLKLDVERIPYAVVSVDKLIEIAERMAIIEMELRELKKNMLSEQGIESIVIDHIVPHVADYRDNKLFVRGMEEDGSIYLIEVPFVGEPEIDPDMRG